MFSREFLDRTGVANLFVLVVIAIFLGVIAWTQYTHEDEVLITYHPEVNLVCSSTDSSLVCSQWWLLVEPWERTDLDKTRFYGVTY